MPSHWGSPELNIVSQGSPTGTQCLHAVGVRGSRADLRAVDVDPRSRDEVPRRRDRLLLARRRRHERRRVLGVAEHRVRRGSCPCVYVVEDNGYAISVPVEAQTPGGYISNLVERFPHLKVLRVDGSDFIASYRGAAAKRSQWASERQARRSCTRRWSARTRIRCPTTSVCTRRPKSARTRQKRDPLARDARVPARGGARDRSRPRADGRRGRSRDCRRDRSGARGAEARRDRRPPTGSFRPTWIRRRRRSRRRPSRTASPTRWSPRSIARCATRWRSNPRIVVFGEDVADCSREDHLAEVSGKGGVFKVTHGLQREFGSTRVFNSPLAEANIVGRAFGMAVRGIKPVVEIQFFDYIWPAMMQIRDEISMLRYRSGNTCSCPMVIRVADWRLPARRRAVSQPVGREHLRALPWHSRRVSRRTAQDAAGLLRTVDSLRRPGALPRAQAPVSPDLQQGRLPRRDYMIPFGKGALRRDGTDVVVLTWGALVQRALLAAQQAEKEGISVAVFDLRTIIPYDWAGISALVQKTNRVIVAHEDQLTCGFGAEIAARIADELFPLPRRPDSARRCPRLPRRLRPGAGGGDPSAVRRRLRAIRDVCRY